MGFKYSIYDDGLYFLTHTVIDWIDLFTRREVAQIVIDSLNYCIDNKGLEVFAWCLMPSHLHMMATVSDGHDRNLSDVMRDFKKYTSKEIIKCIQEIDESRREWMMKHFELGMNHHQVWQEGMHPVSCVSNKFIDQKMDYIHDNPVVAGIVDQPEHYLMSSARDYYANRKGLVNISFI